MFIHLRTHSWYSFLAGIPAPQALARAARQMGMSALGLSDLYTLTGAIEFWNACQAEGIQPILGLEIPVAPAAGTLPPLPDHTPGRIVLLAENFAGWGSLCTLSSALHAEPGSEPLQQLAWGRLAAHTEGLVCLSGGAAGEATHCLRLGAPQAAAAYLDSLAQLFPGRLYVETQHQTEQDRLWALPLETLATRLGLPLVATQDVYYLAPHEAKLQRLVSAIRRNQPIRSVPAAALAPPEAWMRTPEDMLQAFAGLPEALAATHEVAERCRWEMPLRQPHFPAPPIPAGQTARDVLRQKAEAGAIELYGSLGPDIQARLEHELQVIETQGYASLFLIVEEILAYARRQGVPLSSRGSAASSLVAHCLGITSPDPLRLNLYFERFLNPARSTPPDIDTDLCSRRRDGVIRFVYERYGNDRVAMVCTINRFRRRSALREAAKAHGMSSEAVKDLVDRLPHGWGPPWRDDATPDPYGELTAQFPQPEYAAIFADASLLRGRPRHLSIHPGGIVISPGPMNHLAPTQMAAKGVRITQFDLESIEQLGLVKIDLLGIRGLTVLGDVAEWMASQQTPPPAAPLDPLESIPEHDLAVSDMLENGRTIGCFQIESPGMRATLREIHARTPDDLMVALALYRPGPLTGGMKQSFVRRHRGLEQVEHLHPALAPLLGETHGVLIYQEQVLRLAHELAGLSLADADLLRRAMSHFDPGEKMKALRQRFIEGAVERSGLPEATAGQVWELMAAFAGYGFPKAHAASYAQVAWRAAWCKLYYPAPFMAAVLANWGGYYSQRVYLNEARRMGLTLRPPHVNYAGPEFCVRYLEGEPVLFMGLSQVKELTHRTQERIFRLRPFHSLADFLARVDPRPQEAENLARVGALRGWGSIPSLLRELKGGWQPGQMALFSLTPSEAEDWNLAEKVSAQEALLGVGVDAHPLELAAEATWAAGAYSTLEAATRLGERLRLAGMRQTWIRSRTVRGEAVYSMTLEDLEGMLEVSISAEVYRRSRSALNGPGPYLVEGQVRPHPASGEPFLVAEKISLLEP